MIKTKKCLLCDNYAFSKGLCKNHMSKGSIKSKNKLKKEEKYNDYFEHLISNCYVSDNSGVSIINPNKSNIAHILPKRNHSSVGDDLDNYLYLTFKEHERFDYLLFSHEFEKIEKEFPKVIKLLIERLNKILPRCEETTPLKIAIEKWMEKLKLQI